MSPATRRRPLRILISAGPTREPIDAVRFLSNYSTGLMGACLVAEARRRGHRVVLVSGPTNVNPPKGVRTIWVEQARQMSVALRRHAPWADVIIMAAAVCDFQPVRPTRAKLPRQGRLSLALRATPDLVGTLPRRPGQLVVGFALETQRALSRAAEKLRRKRLDLIVGQQMSASPPRQVLPAGRGGGSAFGGNGTSPFGRHPVNAFLLRRCAGPRRLGVVSKTVLARAILDEIEQLWYGGTARQPAPAFRTGRAGAGWRDVAASGHRTRQAEGGSELRCK